MLQIGRQNDVATATTFDFCLTSQLLQVRLHKQYMSTSRSSVPLLFEATHMSRHWTNTFFPDVNCIVIKRNCICYCSWNNYCWILTPQGNTT